MEKLRKDKVLLTKPCKFLDSHSEPVEVPPGEYELEVGKNPNSESVALWLEIKELGVGLAELYLTDHSNMPDSGITYESAKF
jgi:hypothetical protein